MTTVYIPVQRTFSEVLSAEQENFSENFSYFQGRHKTTWENITKLYRIVILTEAGRGGKS